MTDIQQARDVLAKRRKKARSAGPQEDFWFDAALDNRVKPLILLTAGNPELLDAIDDQFALHSINKHPPRYLVRIAAAIIAADEAMTK